MNNVVAFGRSLLTLSALVLCIAAATSFGATFVVNTTADTVDATPGDGICLDSGGTCSLRAAIGEANAFAGADNITLPAGTYTITLTGTGENANASGDFDLNSDITINGAGSLSTIVQGAAARGVATERVFHLRTANTMALNNMTVRWGRYTTAAGTFGAGVRIDSAAVNATLTNVTVTENDNGTSGGGIAVSGATNAVLTLNNCTVSDNTAGGTAAGSSIGAGIMGNTTSATININNSTITGNTVSNTSTTVSASGGGVSSVGTLNITNSTISNNTATSSGQNAFTGGVHVTAGTATITGSTISGNQATVTAGTGAALIGGVYNQQTTVNIINTTITGNSVSNTATPANAFHAGVRTLGSTVAATTNITNSTISNNTANGEGGGVVNISGGAANATTNITGSTISGNTVLSATGLGGGLENFNTAAGLAVINATNSTISGNSANTGAGSFNTGANSTINYNFATIASNTAATLGGGTHQAATGVTNLKNSVVADNAAPTGPDISGTITSQDYNHVENTTGGTFLIDVGGKGGKLVTTSFLPLPGDVTGTDPQLGPLAVDFGGTFTHLPAATSPVIDSIPTGTNDCGTVVTTSQSTIARPFSIGCEKGAAERSIPTSAGASISGRVVTADGNGIRNAVITVSNGTFAEPRVVRTGAFGYFSFDDLPVGDTYVVTINSKRYTFTNPSRVITLTDNIGDVDFVSEP